MNQDSGDSIGMAQPAKKQALSGWGRYPVQESQVYRPEKRRSVEAILRERAQPHYIARGLGRSYGDAATNGGGGIISCLRLDRMLDFDEEQGILHCEAGVTLEDIIETFLPRGFFLSVTPGTKFVTVGGAIAHDVHGKNHHRDGSFGQFVLDLELLTPRGDVLRCSPDENSDVFWATVGGAGLTGVILTARMRLQPVESAYCVVDYRKLPNLDALLTALDESDEDYQYSVAWVDCLAKGKRLGRSVLMLGNHAKREDLPPRQRDNPFDIAGKKLPGVPFDFPKIALNPLTMGTFNGVFYAMSSTKDGTIKDYENYFYPLDAVQNWNRLYGKAGFVQYQLTVPLEERQGMVEILDTVSKSGRASFLAVLKKLGPANPGLLSFPMAGFTLTMDFGVRKGLTEFMHSLDEKLLEHGGRLYLAKDAVATAETFRAMYARLDEFIEIQRRLDPDHVLSSTLARRLGIVEGGP